MGEIWLQLISYINYSAEGRSLDQGCQGCGFCMGGQQIKSTCVSGSVTCVNDGIMCRPVSVIL